MTTHHPARQCVATRFAIVLALILGLSCLVELPTPSRADGGGFHGYVAVSRGMRGKIIVFELATGLKVLRFRPYRRTFTIGADPLRVAVGDLENDGQRELVTIPGLNGKPQLRIFDALTGKRRKGHRGKKYPFGPSFFGGSYVALGDVNGDGCDDFIVAVGGGAAPQINLISGKKFAQIDHFFAYETSFTNGVRVAAGKVSSSSHYDIITAPAPGRLSTIRIFNGMTQALVREFQAYPDSYKFGFFVAAADITGDGVADIITAPGVGGEPRIRVFDGATGVMIRDFLATDSSFKGGVHVAVVDANNDGTPDVVVAFGEGMPMNLMGQVTVFKIFNVSSPTAALLCEAKFDDPSWSTSPSHLVTAWR